MLLQQSRVAEVAVSPGGFAQARGNAVLHDLSIQEIGVPGFQTAIRCHARRVTIGC